jgi:hypothetical protein
MAQADLVALREAFLRELRKEQHRRLLACTNANRLIEPPWHNITANRLSETHQRSGETTGCKAVYPEKRSAGGQPAARGAAHAGGQMPAEREEGGQGTWDEGPGLEGADARVALLVAPRGHRRLVLDLPRCGAPRAGGGRRRRGREEAGAVAGAACAVESARVKLGDGGGGRGRGREAPPRRGRRGGRPRRVAPRARGSSRLARAAAGEGRDVSS